MWLDPFGDGEFTAGEKREERERNNRAVKIHREAYCLCLVFKWKSFQNDFGKFRQLSSFNCRVCLCQCCFSLLLPYSLLHQPLIKAQGKPVRNDPEGT